MTRDERGLFVSSGLLDGIDLTQATADLLTLPGVTIRMIRRARQRAGVTEWARRAANAPKPKAPPQKRMLEGADLTRSYAELMDAYGVCRRTVYNARRAAGMESLRAPKAQTPKVRQPRPERPKREPKVKAPPVAKIPTPKKPTPTREIRVPAPPPIVAEDAIVAAIEDELVVYRSAFTAALMVSSRLKRPMDELLPVAERLMGRAA